MTKLNPDQLTSIAAKALDRSVAQLDVAIQSRLDEIRQQALLKQQDTIATDEYLERIVEASKVSLDDSSQALNPEINQRLDTMRSEALAQSDKTTKSDSMLFTDQIRQFFDNLRVAVPVSGFASAFALVIVVSLVYQNSGPTGSPFIDDDIVMFASSDEIELYENLEFYQWLADNGFSE